MEVNEHEKLSNFTLKYIFKYMNITFIAVLHFQVTGCSSNMKITHILLVMSMY